MKIEYCLLSVEYLFPFISSSFLTRMLSLLRNYITDPHCKCGRDEDVSTEVDMANKPQISPLRLT